jgi:hypothetical protein
MHQRIFKIKSRHQQASPLTNLSLTHTIQHDENIMLQDTYYIVMHMYVINVA